MKRLIVLGIVLLLLGGVGIVGAAMGLYKMPVVSDQLTTVPTPTRTVATTDVHTVFNESIIKPVGTSTDQYRITLSDEQLTVIARQALGSTDGYFEPGVQLVSVPGNLELFGLLRKPAATTVLIRVAPAVKDGTLTGALTYVQIGAVPVPASTFNPLITTVVDKIKAALEQYAKGYTVSSVVAENGTFIIDLQRSVQ